MSTKLRKHKDIILGSIGRGLMKPIFCRFIVLVLVLSVSASNFVSAGVNSSKDKQTLYSMQTNNSGEYRVAKKNNNFKKANSFQTFPLLNLPTADLTFYETGDVKRGLTQFYLDPKGKNFGVDFSATAAKNPKIRKFVWQVSSIAFSSGNQGLSGENTANPRGLLLSGETSPGKFIIDFAQVARKANLADAPKANTVRQSNLNLSRTQVTSVSPFKKKTKRFKRLRRNNRLKSIPQLRLFGDRVFHVRVIPLVEVNASSSANKAELYGKPSKSLPVFWKKLPPNGLVFHRADEEFDLKITSFEFIPFLLIKNWPSGCKQIPDDDGKTSWEVIKDAPSFIKNAINWVSKSYAQVKSSVVTWTARMLPLVNEQMVALALDGALAAAGIPPSLPNLDQLMSGGADYLAMQMASQIPVPASGILAEMAAEEARKEVRKRTKRALLQAAEEVKNIRAASVIYCQQYTEMPYLKIKVKNRSSKKTHRNFVLSVKDDKRLFQSTYLNIGEIKPNETLTLPVFFLDKANIIVKKRSQLPEHDFRKAEGEWWNKYTTTNFKFKITGPETRDCYGNSCSFETEELYKSPRRDYWNGKPFKKTR